RAARAGLTRAMGPRTRAAVAARRRRLKRLEGVLRPRHMLFDGFPEGFEQHLDGLGARYAVAPAQHEEGNAADAEACRQFLVGAHGARVRVALDDLPRLALVESRFRRQPD